MYKEMYLMLTDSCPNRCEYCYIKHKAHPDVMPVELAENIIETNNPDRIIFFGGEPLLQLDMIQYLIKKYYGQYKFQVVTSTTVNFDEFIKFNKEYPLNEIQLSWDGFNHNRIDSNNNYTAYRVYENIMKAIDEGMKFDIKCVISNNNVSEMVELHEMFRDKFKPLGISGQFVIAHRDLYIYDFFKHLKNNLIYTFDLDKLYMEHLNHLIAYYNKDYSFSSCDGGKYVVYTPKGEVSYCTALSQEDIKIDSDTLQAPSKDPECMSCKYGFMCDGGCRYERYHAFKENWQYHHLESTCKMTKIWIETIEKFITSLSMEQKEILLKEVNRYQNYMKEYFRGRN